jgi:hypothetical protein
MLNANISQDDLAKRLGVVDLYLIIQLRDKITLIKAKMV